MEPLAVVKDFNSFRDGSLGFRPRAELATMHQLAFKTAPEAFHGGVVMAVAPATHAGNEAYSCQPLPVGFAGVLAATIRVMH